MEKFLVEKLLPKTIVAPVDLNTAANTGLRFDMKNCKRATFICILGAGTTTTTHGFALKQHLVPTAGVPLALSVDNPYYHKIGAATSFAKVPGNGTPVDTFDLHALLANNANIVVFEVLSEQLTDGYRYVSLDITKVGGAQLGSVIALGDMDFSPAYSDVA